MFIAIEIMGEQLVGEISPTAQIALTCPRGLHSLTPVALADPDVMDNIIDCPFSVDANDYSSEFTGDYSHSDGTPGAPCCIPFSRSLRLIDIAYKLINKNTSGAPIKTFDKLSELLFRFEYVLTPSVLIPESFPKSKINALSQTICWSGLGILTNYYKKTWFRLQSLEFLV